MKRKIGVGDIVVIVGLGLVFAFLLVSIVSARYDTAWPLINGILLLLLTLGAGGILAMSLMGSAAMLNVLYMFAGFIIILHCSLFPITSYRPGRPGMEFLVFVGALLVGLGTYMIQKGTALITGEEKKK